MIIGIENINILEWPEIKLRSEEKSFLLQSYLKKGDSSRYLSIASFELLIAISSDITRLYFSNFSNYLERSFLSLKLEALLNML